MCMIKLSGMVGGHPLYSLQWLGCLDVFRDSISRYGLCWNRFSCNAGSKLVTGRISWDAQIHKQGGVAVVWSKLVDTWTLDPNQPLGHFFQAFSAERYLVYELQYEIEQLAQRCPRINAGTPVGDSRCRPGQPSIFTSCTRSRYKIGVHFQREMEC